MILLEAKINPNIKSEYGSIPIQHAVYNKQIEIVHLLLAAGANPNAVYNRQTPLDLTLLFNYSAIAELLRSYGGRKL